MSLSSDLNFVALAVLVFSPPTIFHGLLARQFKCFADTLMSSADCALE
jgi:hypothetical protein